MNLGVEELCVNDSGELMLDETCWTCLDSLSDRKVSAKYSIRTRPVNESSDDRASIFLWTGASSISASSASRRAFASWSFSEVSGTRVNQKDHQKGHVICRSSTLAALFT